MFYPLARSVPVTKLLEMVFRLPKCDLWSHAFAKLDFLLHEVVTELFAIDRKSVV